MPTRTPACLCAARAVAPRVLAATHPPLQVLGLQRSERVGMPNRAARRALLRAARDATDEQHEQFMATVYSGQHAAPREALGDRPAAPPTAAVARDASRGQAEPGPKAPSQAAACDGAADDGEADQLLMEACGSGHLDG